MVIQIKINDGITTKTRTYRNIRNNAEIIRIREGHFFAQKPFNKWGMMTQLHGARRIVWGQFGKVEA